jgi:hypothetical protein
LQLTLLYVKTLYITDGFLLERPGLCVVTELMGSRTQGGTAPFAVLVLVLRSRSDLSLWCAVGLKAEDIDIDVAATLRRTGHQVRTVLNQDNA